MNPTSGAVHYQHNIYFRTATLYYPRVNYKWYAEASRTERREQAEVEFSNTDTPWDLLWNSDNESVTSTNTHGDIPEDYLQVRNLKFPDVRAVVQEPPSEYSQVVVGWVEYTKSDYTKYKRTKYAVCNTTGKTY